MKNTDSENNNKNDYFFWLPDNDGKEVQHQTNKNSIIIIGANGSGKSKLGAWIEQKHFNKVHRIGAQRNLDFQENIPLQSYIEAENRVLYGTPFVNDKNDKRQRWDYGKYTTKLINDVEPVLAALIAQTNNDCGKFTESCKLAEQNNNSYPKVPTTSFDKLKRVWNNVFPQRQISLQDGHFYASFTNKEGTKSYLANGMSDGERAVLYLAAQVICVPENKILIIDEPEIHLHKLIMNKLWSELENIRQDCLFIYITHDTEFAASHFGSEKFWIKEFDGACWIINQIKDNELPEDLYMQILGSRKNVIFVEGTKNSYDYQLYSKIYSDYTVIPCGSCVQVISYTKAFDKIKQLHNYEVYGIIDRDFHSDKELDAYKKYNIFPLKVAEIENLFLVEELIKLIAKSEMGNDNEIFQNVANFVMHTKFDNLIQKQICNCLISEINYKLSTCDIKGNNVEQVQNNIADINLDEIYDNMYKVVKNKYESAKDNYSEILKVFNEKGVAREISRFFNYSDYCLQVLRFLDSDMKEQIKQAIKPYLPEEISI